MPLEIVRHYLNKEEADAIVIVANRKLTMGSGVLVQFFKMAVLMNRKMHVMKCVDLLVGKEEADYLPKTKTTIGFAIALKLNEDVKNDLLSAAGYFGTEENLFYKRVKIQKMVLTLNG